MDFGGFEGLAGKEALDLGPSKGRFYCECLQDVNTVSHRVTCHSGVEKLSKSPFRMPESYCTIHGEQQNQGHDRSNGHTLPVEV